MPTLIWRVSYKHWYDAAGIGAGFYYVFNCSLMGDATGVGHDAKDGIDGLGRAL